MIVSKAKHTAYCATLKEKEVDKGIYYNHTFRLNV